MPKDESSAELSECSHHAGHEWFGVSAMIEGHGHFTTSVVEQCEHCKQYRRRRDVGVLEVEP